MSLSEHAASQGRMWGTDPEGWLLHGEPHNEPLFLAVLDAARVERGTRLLDVGCGTGGALALALDRGAVVTGIDVSDTLLAVARERLGDADLVHGEAEALPFADCTFDAVIGVNAFQFAEDPRVALREAARVVLPGGRVVASLFAEPARSEATEIHHALNAICAPTAEPSTHAPYALSDPGNLQTAMSAAGLRVIGSGEVPCTWWYADEQALVRGILSSGGGARALTMVDRDTAAHAIVAAAQPFIQDDGSIRMRNLFRWVSSRREE